MHALEAATMHDLADFRALPTYMQDLWRAHAFARLSGRYDAVPQGSGATKSQHENAAAVQDVVAAWRAACEAEGNPVPVLGEVA